MNIKILSATHKPYRMPEEAMYIPLQVNCAANGHFDRESFANVPHAALERYCFDDDRINISEKNPYYCELTALYWGWKNLSCEYMGLVHYRRYFTGASKGDKWQRILTEAQLEPLLTQLAGKGIYCILPNKRHYVIETLYSHYAHSHHEQDLKAAIQVIHGSFPDYTDAFVQVMNRRSAHMFNMCIMRKDLLDQYCSWLFDVLGQIEDILDTSGYTDFDKRVYGRISELLLDVWITKHGIGYHELPIENIEGENWLKKIPLFLRRKLSPEHRI